MTKLHEPPVEAACFPKRPEVILLDACCRDQQPASMYRLVGLSASQLFAVYTLYKLAILLYDAVFFHHTPKNGIGKSCVAELA